MIPELIKKRLAKEREMTSITLRIPVDVVDSLKAIAPKRGLGGYQTLLKLYLSEALRIDEARYLLPGSEETTPTKSQRTNASKKAAAQTNESKRLRDIEKQLSLLAAQLRLAEGTVDSLQPLVAAAMRT